MGSAFFVLRARVASGAAAGKKRSVGARSNRAVAMKFDYVDFVSELVSFQSVSADSSRAGQTAACARFLDASFKSWGFESEIFPTRLHPIVFAERKCSGGSPKARVLFYGHYDVQPEDPAQKWNTPAFECVAKGGRIFGRGTADNKGPFSCIIAGMLAFLEKNPGAPIDIGFVLEGEEEIGSPSMADFMARRRDELAGYDFMALSDTSSAAPDKIVATVGLRGTASFEVKFVGANVDVHSGMYGGVVYNPLQAMFETCASLHGADGLVNIPHFYDGIVGLCDWERAEMKKSPVATEAAKKLLGIKEFYAQNGFEPDEALRALPTLEFTGAGGGYQGEGVKSVIPSECFCKISCRAAAGQDIRRLLELAKRAISERAPSAVSVEFSDCESYGEPYFVDPKNPPSPKLAGAFCAMEKCVREVFGCSPIFLREGASIPLISDLKRETGLDCLMLGLFLPGDNLHAPNESFSLDMARRGALYYERFLEEISC